MLFLGIINEFHEPTTYNEMESPNDNILVPPLGENWVLVSEGQNFLIGYQPSFRF